MNLTKDDIKFETCEIFDDDNFRIWTKKFEFKGATFYIDNTYFEPIVKIGVKHPFMMIEELTSNCEFSEIENFIINYINTI